VKGPREYESQGPFGGEGSDRSRRPPRMTGTGDAPDRCLGTSESQPPHHPASAVFPGEPVPTGWTLVSEPSRPPLRKGVGEVLCPVAVTAQGVRANFLRILRVPACRPQNRRALSPSRSAILHSFGHHLWIKARRPQGAYGPNRPTRRGPPWRAVPRSRPHSGCPYGMIHARTHRFPVQPGKPPPAPSKAAAISSNRRSWPCAATSWTPTGSPSTVRPAGTEIAGQPVAVMRYAERIQSR